jgi:hypothetical protein
MRDKTDRAAMYETLARGIKENNELEYLTVERNHKKL